MTVWGFKKKGHKKKSNRAFFVEIQAQFFYEKGLRKPDIKNPTETFVEIQALSFYEHSVY